MYADDTVLLLWGTKSKALEMSSLISIKMAIQYCQIKTKVIKREKAQQFTFGRRKDAVSRIPDIETPERAKYLGVIIDHTLKWSPYIYHLW